MAKLRHIALEVSNAEQAAAFFENAFGLKRVARGGRSIHLSDGVMNVALLQAKGANVRLGLAHFGFWVDEFESAEKRALDAGAVCLQGPPPDGRGAYEAKYRGPDGIVFDLTHTGWPGAARDARDEPAD